MIGRRLSQASLMATLTLRWKGAQIFEGPIDWNPGRAQLVLGGRTGGASSNHHIDEIYLFPTPSSLAFVSDVRTSHEFVELDIDDLGSSVLDPNAVRLLIDDVDVTAEATVQKNGDITTIRHHQLLPFLSGTTHSYSLSARDNNQNDVRSAGQFTVETSFGRPFMPFDRHTGAPIALLGAENIATYGNWGVRYIFTAGAITSSAEALALIQAAADDPDNFAGSLVDVAQPEINHSDTGDRGLHTPDLPYPSEAVAAGCCGDNFIQYAVGYIQIERAGSYTIGTHTDDGFALRVHGWTFSEVHGNGQIDPDSHDSIVHLKATSDSDTRAIADDVQPGVYRVEFFWWENGVYDHGELYIAQGRFPNDANTTEWLPIGRVETSGSSTGVPGFDGVGVTVTSFNPGLVEDPISNGGNDFDRVPNPFGGNEIGLSNFSEVALAFSNPNLPQHTSNHDAVNFHDPELGGSREFFGDEPFPLNTNDDDNHFPIAFEANLVIPVSGIYHLGFQGDDGAYLRIPGQVFSGLKENMTGNSVIDESGARIICDCLASNSRTVGEITLAAGTYLIEGAFFERRGAATFEVFGSQPGSPHTLLVRNGAHVQETHGVRLVDPPDAVDLPESTIVARWSFEGDLDDTALFDNIADDLTDNASGVTYVPGVIGQAVAITNTPGRSNELTASSSSELNLLGDWTMEAYIWRDTNNLQSNQWERFWTKRSLGDNEYHWAIRGFDSETVPDGLDWQTNNALVIDHSATVTIPFETWTHIALVGDQSGSGTISGWVNGIQVVSVPYVAITPTAGSMHFGNFGTGDQSSFQFSGYIDEALIHKEAVNEAYLQSRTRIMDLDSYEAWAALWIPEDRDRSFGGDWNSDGLTNGYAFGIGAHSGHPGSASSRTLTFRTVSASSAVDLEFGFLPGNTNLIWIVERGVDFENFEEILRLDDGAAAHGLQISAILDPVDASKLIVTDRNPSYPRCFYQLRILQNNAP